MVSDASTIKAAQVAVSILPGARIFAVAEGTKSPIGSWVANSTRDLTIIEHLFLGTRHNIGLHIGKEIAVLDVEGLGKGKGAPGEEGLKLLIEALGPLPDTITAQTPSGGLHLYFRIPYAMQKQAKAAGTPNVEFRTGDHYMVLPPSVLADGSGYKWLPNHSPEEISLGDLPAGWVTALDAYSPPLAPCDNSTDQQSEFAKLLEEERAERFKKTPPPEFAPILAGCAWMRNIVEEPQSEPDWYAALSIIGRCKNGEKLAHTVSKIHPNYDRAETQAKLEQSLLASGPRTCAGIASDRCGACLYAQKGDNFSPLNLGRSPENIVEVCQELVYVTDIGAAMLIEDRSVIPMRLYADSVSHRVRGQTRARLLESPALMKVRRTDYLAGDERLIVNGAANRWRNEGIEPRKGDASPIVNFFEAVIPDQASREHIFNYLAHLIQFPSVKVNHGLMWTGPQGTGKSTFVAILKRMFGETNSRTVPGKSLESRWQAGFVDCQLLCFEEAACHGKWEAGEHIKILMTDEYFQVEEKGIPAWRGRTPRGVAVLTNHAAGVVISSDDRRWHVSATVNRPISPTFYSQVSYAIQEGSAAAAFVEQLLRRDIRDFNPKAEPPMTEAKRAAQRATAIPVAQILFELLDDGSLEHDIYSVTELISAVNHRNPYGVTVSDPHQMGQALKGIGSHSLNARPWANGKRLRLWAIRNTELYRDMSDIEVTDAYKNRGAPSFIAVDHIAREAAKVIQLGGGGA